MIELNFILLNFTTGKYSFEYGINLDRYEFVSNINGKNAKLELIHSEHWDQCSNKKLSNNDDHDSDDNQDDKDDKNEGEDGEDAMNEYGNDDSDEDEDDDDVNELSGGNEGNEESKLSDAKIINFMVSIYVCIGITILVIGIISFRSSCYLRKKQRKGVDIFSFDDGNKNEDVPFISLDANNNACNLE